MAGWLSNNPSWRETERRNGQLERDRSHRKAIHHIERQCSVLIRGGLSAVLDPYVGSKGDPTVNQIQFQVSQQRFAAL